ncbi:tyrosine--tRNA ligase [Laribacter hongkongensis]|uniref:tyrosine--tRNA ligase n=1 Tax=Laribacter hongkongensis TaxID=168471 RepID=UPI001EFE5D2A|nr:tyrosine--tRNA ligase [Laribacter hongkongensis]MCG9031030.1 tyrosine--tRNA ligase [Laribacter hongkongensis]MCG9090711.1 tyrosine--tRNA ligase [Laribacter hongkongensis]
MSERNVIQELEARGLIAQQTDSGALQKLLESESVTLYCGFDPTADSLHLGHLVPLLMLRRFQQAGHRPIALVGGATGMIGDPSFKAAERKLNTPDVIAGWVDKIRRQLSPFLSFEGDNAAVMANNYDWFGQMNVLEFLRDIGKHFSVNAMIKKESVQQRISREDQGISFTEFSYSLLQGNDFAELNRRFGCKLQIGGSDQWGNITAGIDLTRRLNQQQVFGLTVPLITNSDGTKFGKSEGNAVWLDPQKCSPYKFYQFWLGVADADVYRFLRYFTFLSIEQIDAIEAADKTSGTRPQAQRILAEEATRLVHGDEALKAAQRITESLFSNDLSALMAEDLAQLALDGLPVLDMAGQGDGLIDALAASGLAKSKSEARTFIQSGAVSINGIKAEGLDYCLTGGDRLFGRYTLLKRGKKLYALLVWPA